MGEGERFTIKKRARSFGYAFAGIGYVLRTQHNAWIHAAITLAVILLALWLEVSLVEWAILVLAMMVVWVAEFVNTAVEMVIDLRAPEHEFFAGTAKDVAAGAVLVAALGAAAVGLLILGPPLLERIFR
ncbi:MAG: diacylglycerol kinase family protein [Chloroflexota bacterium]|nr:MAG: diacylglycerol kinase family protein [Chloroflexota bacterium]